MSDLQYEAGYGKPPKNRRFTNGKSGNPKGRPKGSKNFSTIFHEVGRQKVKVTDNGVTREITKFEASAMQLLNKASTGDMRALNTMATWVRLFQEVVNEPEDEALSETKRKAVNEWFVNTLLSRLNNKETGTIIIVMQRLHQDDLIGHVLERGDWEVLDLPAIAEADEHHGIETIFGTRSFIRKAGEALHPERESLETLRRTREDIGEYLFQSQYQQAPMPKGGAMIKTDWLTYYDRTQLPNSFIYTLQSWDTANKSGELNDYSVCTTWGVVNGKHYLLEVFRRRLDYPELKRAVWDQARKYRHPRILIEDRGSGTQLIQELKREGLLYIKAYDPPSNTDKIMRLFAQSHHFEAGKVLLPREAPWLNEYIRELISFPGSKHDDQVDSTTQALQYMASNNSLEIWAKLGR